MNQFLFKSFFVFSIAVIATSTPTPVKTALIGWTTDGKTFFCNRYDGSYCPTETYQLGESNTLNVSINDHFIDTPGFGENRCGVKEECKDFDKDAKFGPSLNALKKSLIGINNQMLRAIIWMVNCGVKATTAETYEFINIFTQIAGNKTIPLIAVFNPGHADAKCLNNIDGFLENAQKWEVKVSEVIHIDSFKLDEFEKKYSKAYQIVLPSDLDEILGSKDVKILAQKVKKNFDLECQTLPGHLQNIRDNIKDEKGQIKGEESIPTCPALGLCQISIPIFDDCSRTYCSQTTRQCRRRWIVWKQCQEYCSSTAVRNDSSCEASNLAKNKAYEVKIELCKLNEEQKFNTCISNRASQIVLLKQQNLQAEQAINILMVNQQSTIAKLNTCNEI